MSSRAGERYAWCVNRTCEVGAVIVEERKIAFDTNCPVCGDMLMIKEEGL